MSAKIKSAFLGSVTSQVFLLITMLVNLAIIPFSLNYISKSEYGIALILIQVFWYLINFDFGLRTALSRILALLSVDKPEQRHKMNKLVSTSFWAYIVLGLLLSLTGFFIAPYFADIIGIGNSSTGVRVLTILTVFMGLRFPLLSFESLLFAQQKQALSNFIVFLTGITNSLVIAVCLLLDQGIYSFAYALIFSTLLGSGMKIFYIRKHFPFIRLKLSFFSKSLLKEMFGFGFFTTIYSLANQLIMQSDKLLIGALINPAAVAAYAITAKIPEITMTLINKITENSTPVFIARYSEEGNEGLKKAFPSLLKIVTILVFIGFWLVLSFNEAFVGLWVGSDFFSGNMATILTVSFFSMLMITFTNTINLFSSGKIRGFSIVNLIQIGVSIILSIPFARQWGVVGIILASNMAAFITFLYIPIKTMKEIGIPFAQYIKNFLVPALVISLCGGLIYFLIQEYFEANQANLLSFSILAILAGTSMGLFSYLIFLRKDLKDILGNKKDTSNKQVSADIKQHIEA